MTSAKTSTVILVVLCFVGCASCLLQDHSDFCQMQGLISEEFATVAGSYIPGDLHWRRPQDSLAPCFRIESGLQFNLGCTVKIPLKLDPQCAEDLYRKSSRFQDQYENQANFHALFYARLVGPAIQMATVSKELEQDYIVSFKPQKPGRYMLDIVVEFSSVLHNSSLQFYKQPCTYEGRPIPGSPFKVLIAPNKLHELPENPCRKAEIGRAPGTWILADLKEIHTPPQTVNFLSANFSWVPDICKMPNLQCIVEGSKKDSGKCLSPGQRAMIYAIGDSVTRVQAKSLADLLGEKIEGEGETYTQVTRNTFFDIQFQATNGGMIARMVDIKRNIDGLVRCQLSGNCTPILHFNSGLHDLDKYCGNIAHQISFRRDANLEDNFDCITNYVTLLQEVVDYVISSGLQGVKVFRTTTAAWLKFGNYRINWFDPDKRDEQVFINNWFSVVKFNDLALPIFERAGWNIIDGFQSSIGRPDHTERTPGATSGAFVHFDHEVPDAHNHQLLSIIFEEICPNVLETCSSSSTSGQVSAFQPQSTFKKTVAVNKTLRVPRDRKHVRDNYHSNDYR